VPGVAKRHDDEVAQATVVVLVAPDDVGAAQDERLPVGRETRKPVRLGHSWQPGGIVVHATRLAESPCN
jgi:hypothetical protein